MARVKYLHLNMLLISGNFVVLTILLIEISFAGCSLSLLQVGSRVGVRLCRPASIHTWEQFMREFLHAFENYDYDNLCAEILELKKNEMNLLNILLSDLLIFAIGFLWMIGPLTMI
jgi:hypothetical protein